ncbi:hypothetical protein [Tepidiforma sp.]|uniref:hypothetical protein n=1 Tax=Tepidiforma sp. TaxID=2682230 RepID=UPI002ADD877E|nr:hypothetical protein [Tepidiforma sp.]
MSIDLSWEGPARVAREGAFEQPARARLERPGGNGHWRGELVLAGALAVRPGETLQLVVRRSPCRAVVLGAAIRGGPGHRTTTVVIEGEGRPPACIRPPREG